YTTATYFTQPDRTALFVSTVQSPRIRLRLASQSPPIQVTTLHSKACSSTSAKHSHSSSLSSCSDMSLHSFGLEPLSCHAWNKDRT
ncbi:hypothetical protein ATANTOWER_020541, partial [Ataeniobius toweri]|nr:hypothetical protein [Ataeniobius toweri]